MEYKRYLNHQWRVSDHPNMDGAALCVLMDIRDELQAIKRLMGCYRIPRALDAMARLDKRMALKNPLRPAPRKKKAA